MPRKSAAAPETKPAARAQRPAAKASSAKPATKATVKLAAKAPAKAAAIKTAAKPARPVASGKGGVRNAVKTAAKALTAPAPAPRKPAAKPVARAAAKSPAKAPAVLVERVGAEDARPVLVRDSFTMPEQEYAVLLEVKQACLRAGIDVKKSELLRIGVALLGQLDVSTLQGVLAALPQLKTGRPPR